MEKKVIGLIEKIKIFGRIDTKEVFAKVDTGASKSSIDINLASKLQLGPIIETKVVKSAQGSAMRGVVRTKILLAGRELHGKFTIADRRYMKYPVLLGQDILKEGFWIDPAKETSKK